MRKLSLEDIALKQKWFDEITNQSVEDRLQMIDLEEDNVLECFEIYLRNTLFVTYFDNWEDLHVSSIMQRVLDAIKNGCKIHLNKVNSFINYWYFVGNEIDTIERFITIKNANSDVHKKAVKYAAFLEANINRYFRLDELQVLLFQESRPNLKYFLSDKLKKGYVDLEVLNNKQQELFYYLDSVYNLNLVSHCKSNYLSKYKTTIEEKFDFEGYKNPIRLQEFPSEKLKFQKLLKTWFLEQIETRKKIFEWKKIPEEYQFLVEYATSIVPSPEESKPTPIQQKESPLQIPESAYPKHIFNDAKSFELFNFLMKYYRTSATIGFLYRTMAEKENPKLILVNDTPFRNWFNEQNFEIQLENHTKTYEGVKNEDRISTYNIAKTLIFNK